MIRSLSLIVIVALFAGLAGAQVPVATDVFPEAAAPGDTIRICGTGLGNATHVRFWANVGGFAGQLPFIVLVSSVSPTEVTAVVPLVNAFAPPNAVPPGVPVGAVEVRDAGGLFSNQLSFFFTEATPAIDIVGLGSTNSNLARAATSFTVGGGAPTAGNGTFELTLNNATPNTTAILAFGAPATPPGIPLFDGFVAIDLTQVQLLPNTFLTDAKGNLSFPIPIPMGAAGVTGVVQWAYLDGPTAQIANALQATF